MIKSKKQFESQKGQSLPNMTEYEARMHLEGIRWPNGPVCPQCKSSNVYEMQGMSIRPGLRRCRECKKQFTVTVGTIFEDSHLPLSIWIQAFHLICASKKGISSLQLQRNLGLGSYRTAWYLSHRIRLAMKTNPKNFTGTVEVDETYVGGKPPAGIKSKRGRGTYKTPVVVVVERDGRAYSRPVDRVTSANLRNVIRECAADASAIHTDEFASYRSLSKHFAAKHEFVNHGEGEYSRNGVNTNTAESYFALLKRGIRGTFHHISKKHLHRYCNEFEFRWNSRKHLDLDRRDWALKHTEDKLLRFRELVGN
ncbi:MAG TPA: IS1595 family transposase [Verrucomicrobiae bacterium]|jgi:transposase-like protein